jgi:hypothetical protein
MGYNRLLKTIKADCRQRKQTILMLNYQMGVFSTNRNQEKKALDFYNTSLKNYYRPVFSS